MFTAIIVGLPSGSDLTTIVVRPVFNARLATVFAYMKEESRLEPEEIDSILLVRNGNGNYSPEVFKQWSAANGDFRGL
jgi:hypothetical protein